MAAEKEIKKNRINREIKFRLIKFRLRARSITSPPPAAAAAAPLHGSPLGESAGSNGRLSYIKSSTHTARVAVCYTVAARYFGAGRILGLANLAE